MNDPVEDPTAGLASAIRASMEAGCVRAEEPWGAIVKNPAFPRIHRANFVWLTALPSGGLREVFARSDAVFGSDIPHRAIYAADPSIVAGVQPTLGREGFAFRASDLMVARTRPPIRVNPSVTLQAVEEERVRRDFDQVSLSIFHEEAYAPEVVEQLLSLHWVRHRELDREAYVAYADGAPAGIIGLDVVEGAGLIYDVATAPAFRRRGVASTMVDSILRRADARGLTLLGLETIHEREVWRIYESMGFARVGVLAKFHR